MKICFFPISFFSPVVLPIVILHLSVNCGSSEFKIKQDEIVVVVAENLIAFAFFQFVIGGNVVVVFFSFIWCYLHLVRSARSFFFLLTIVISRNFLALQTTTKIEIRKQMKLK